MLISKFSLKFIFCCVLNVIILYHWVSGEVDMCPVVFTLSEFKSYFWNKNIISYGKHLISVNMYFRLELVHMSVKPVVTF